MLEGGDVDVERLYSRRLLVHLGDCMPHRRVRDLEQSGEGLMQLQDQEDCAREAPSDSGCYGLRRPDVPQSVHTIQKAARRFG